MQFSQVDPDAEAEAEAEASEAASEEAEENGPARPKQPPVQLFLRSSEESHEKALLQKEFSAPRFIKLASIQVTLSLIAFFAACLINSYDYHFKTGAGFWGGVPAGICATLGFLAVQRPTLCSITAYQVLNVFCLFPMTPAMAWLSFFSFKRMAASPRHSAPFPLFLFFTELSCAVGLFSACALAAWSCHKLIGGSCCSRAGAATYTARANYAAYTVEEGCATHVRAAAPPPPVPTVPAAAPVQDGRAAWALQQQREEEYQRLDSAS